MRTNKKPENKRSQSSQSQLDASFGMVLVDALPVLCFSITIALIASMYHSAAFLVGAVLCICAGLGKVVWKLILAAVHKDIQLLYRQFHYLMPIGFVLILLSLIISRPSLADLWKNVSSFPCNILFALGIAGFVVMGILGAKMSASDKRANWIEQIVNLTAQLVVLGHTCCGAVGAAIAGNAGGYVKSITDRIVAAIHSETDPCKASILNIRNTVSCIRTAFDENEEMAKTEIVGALYDLESGKVTFLK